MKNLLDIFNTLGINSSNGLFITRDNLWQVECQFSSRVERLIKNKIKPDALFVFDNKPLILFYDTPKDVESIHKSIWNFNESPIIIFVSSNSVEIFNGFSYLKEKSTLDPIGNKNTLNDFNYFELVNGETWEKYKSELKYESRVDYHLLKNIKTARELLISKDNLESSITNALIGKVIFVRYLIDRKVKIGFKREKNWSNEDFCSVLSNHKTAVNFFKYLEEKFNGDMFLLNDSEYQSIPQSSLNTLISLLNEEDLGNGQKSLFKLYDFSIIPIEFVSNVYESFIGEHNQAKEGAYYTPLFLVDYILNETVEKYFTINTKTFNCKVLDPACGSGIFLVETLRKIIERYISLNPKIKENTEEFKEGLRKLTIDNIFGIDKNLPAIQVAIFSIQLTLLDYQKPSSVETFRFPKLLHTNFFESDFFNTQHEFNNKLKNTDINFVLGNPPWKGNGMDSIGKQYLKNRKKNEKEKKYSIAVNNGEIAEGFVLRVSDFASSSTEIALIVRSSILYNLGYKTNRSAFRDYWLEEFFIDKIFELAPVRKEVFDKSNDPSVAPTAIVFYKYAEGNNTDNNILEHITLKPSRFFNLFKIFSINRNDIKNVEQKKLKNYDWLWKVLVYGSYLDYNFIIRLKDEFRSIGEIISDKNQFVFGTGIDDSGSAYSAKHLQKYPFLDAHGILPFQVIEEKTSEFIKERVNRPRDQRLFIAPMLLLRNGVDTKTLKARAVVSLKNYVFKKALTSIKAIDKSQIPVLKTINALLCSNLFSYFTINTFSDIGIEREQTKQKNVFSIPFIDCVVESYVSNIEQLKRQIHSEKKKFLYDSNIIEQLESETKSNLEKIDKEIYKSLNLDKKEYSLIDFALNVNRPIITKNKQLTASLFQHYCFGDSALEWYAELFSNRFSKLLNTKSHIFVIEIWYSKQVIGMFFKVVPKKTNNNSIVWVDKSKDELLKMAIKLSSHKITDKLFVQKDLRGFDKEFFYLFKPNEKRLWHKAIGYQDADEFMDAILKTGRRDYIEK